MNIFERAARCKLRFATSGGEYTTELLFDLPLQHATKPNLDSIAVAVHRELKGMAETSFVSDLEPNARKEKLELQLEILKHIIEHKKSVIVANETRVKNAELRRKLNEALEAKEGEVLKNMSPEELKKKLAELDAK